MPTMSTSWKASFPINCVGTCPVRTTRGTESIYAEAMPVTVLVAPGPEVTRHTPHLTGCPGITVRCVNGSLFMADQDVPDIRLNQLVIDVRHGTAREAEDDIHPLFL